MNLGRIRIGVGLEEDLFFLTIIHTMSCILLVSLSPRLQIGSTLTSCSLHYHDMVLFYSGIPNGTVRVSLSSTLLLRPKLFFFLFVKSNQKFKKHTENIRNTVSPGVVRSRTRLTPLWPQNWTVTSFRFEVLLQTHPLSDTPGTYGQFETGVSGTHMSRSKTERWPKDRSPCW